MSIVHILIINTVQYTINGISNVILSHIKSLNSMNDICTHITQWGDVDGRYKQSFEEYNVIPYDVPSRKEDVLSYVRSLKRILKCGKFDIIHIHGNSGTMAIEAWLAKKYTNARIIAHLHNSSCSHPLLYGPNSLLTRIMKRKADCLVACSQKAGEWLYKKKYVVMPNAIDLERFTYNEQARREIRSKYHIGKDEFVIGHIGLFNEQKNHKFLVNVFFEYLKINPKSRLFLVGAGEQVDEIKSLAKTLNIYDNIIFSGNQEDVSPYYSAFDSFVFPSLWEGLGIVTIEAQANGLGVLCSLAVPPEVKFSDHVCFKDVQDGAAAWAVSIDELRTRSCNRKAAPLEEMKRNGYDINGQPRFLRELYCISEE